MATNIKSYPNLIDGIWKTSSDTPLEDRNPADYNEIIGLFPMATLADTKSAIQAARSAFTVWSRTPAPARGAMLDKASQILTSRLVDIATVLTREEGKTLAEAKEEVTRFGLSAGVVTNNLKEAFAFANQVDAGVVKINEPITGLALNAPFGGFKGSSANTFKEQGQAAMDFYTRIKTIYVNHG
jgi:acyl-CoA reductase-like NAD-dependent aldehyde dehydrogenase